MRQTYKILAHVIAATVVIQAVVIAWSTFTVINLLESGATVCGPPVAGMIHSMLGMYVIPLLAVALLVVAFLSHAGIRWAAWLAVVVQIAVAHAPAHVATSARIRPAV